jgi:RNA polymerase sigma-70 factor, ECF subfamily
MDHERTRPKLAVHLANRRDACQSFCLAALKFTVVCQVIARNHRKGGILAIPTQLALIQELRTKNPAPASRQFADALREKSASQDEEAALVVAAQSGDGQAFEILIGRHRQRILAVARRFTRVREDAEDVVQQSFQKAFVHLHKFAGKSSFSTWLTRIAINEALMLLRRCRGLREVSIDDLGGNKETVLGLEMPDTRAGPESAFLRDERSRILSAAMNKLTPGIRKAIELRELGELSTEEAARAMGLSVEAVKGRVFHGRKKLHQVLKRESARMSGKQILRASCKANRLSHHQLVCSSCD